MSNYSILAPRSRLWIIDLGLLTVALSWGKLFLDAAYYPGRSHCSPVLMLRFALAVPFMFVGTRVRLNSFTRGEVINGIVFGVLLYAILTFETFGVKHTSAANAGFLIALSVVLVPFLNVLSARENKANSFISPVLCPCRWRHVELYGQWKY